VDRHRRRTGLRPVAELARDVPADVELGLLRGAADVRGEDHVGDALEAVLEGVTRLLRLGGEDIDGRAGDVAGDEVVPQGLEVDDETPGEVEEEAARAHPGELLRAEVAGIAGAAVDVQRDRLARLEELLEGAALPGIAQGELVLEVEEGDVHAEGLGDDGQLGADVAVADDAERAPPDLVRPLRRLVPDPAVQRGVLVGEVAGQADDLAEGELDDAAGVGEGGVEDDRPGLGGGIEVDLVRADAEGADDLELGSGLEHRAGHVRPGADADHVDALERGDQLRLVDGSGARLDLEAGVDEGLAGGVVDVLEQQAVHVLQGMPAPTGAVGGPAMRNRRGCSGRRLARLWPCVYSESSAAWAGPRRRSTTAASTKGWMPGS